MSTSSKDLRVACVLAAFALFGCDDGTSTDRDADTSEDAGSPSCEGTAQPDLGTSVQLSRGLVIARDGTIYFTQVGGVGRLLPDGTLETDWVTLGGGEMLAGLALDATNANLFAAAPDFSGGSAPSIYRVEVATGVATTVVTGGTPFGLAVGADGMLYFGDTLAEHVFRVDIAGAGGTPVQVTTSPVANARGVAFEASGTLLVASASPGAILRITLSGAGVETMRATVASFPTPDSLALDAMGRIYVTSEGGGVLARMSPEGSGIEQVVPGLSSPFALDFGRGALSCSDLFYVAAGRVMRFENDTPGALTLWH